MKKALRGAAELESVEARLEEMERKLDRLKSLYESFFMGTERTPPNTPRRDLNRMMLELQQVPIGKATLRFRFQSLLQRWVLLTAYWNRTMREIEMGTYRRDLAKAHRHMASRGTALTEEEALQLGIPPSRVKAFVGRQQRIVERAAEAKEPAARPAPPPPTPARPPAPSPTEEGVPGLRPGELEAFYARFVDTHQRVSGAPPKVSLEQMRAKLRQELPKLLGPDGGRVALDLAVEGERVRLKARPIKKEPG